MAWAFVRPSDPELLTGRPLLDLGTGDGQTLAALARPSGTDETAGLVVGTDRSLSVLRAARSTGVARLVCSSGVELPVRDASVATVLAGDLVHHLSDEDLDRVLQEIVRVLRPDGRLVAWWYRTASRPAPDAPRFPRTYEAVAEAVGRSGLAGVGPIELTIDSGAGPETVGLSALRG